MSATSKTEFEAVDVDVEDWIGGVSYLQSKVTIYRDPAILADYVPLMAKIDQLEAELDELTEPDEDEQVAEPTMSGEQAMSRRVPAGERALGEKPVEDPRVVQLRAELDPLYEEAEKLYARYQANTEVWTLRKLNKTEVDEIREETEKAVGVLPAEPQLSKNAKPAARTVYMRKVDAFLAATKAYTLEFNLRLLAASTMSVHVAGVDRGTVTLEQMQRLYARPGGDSHANALYQAQEKLQGEGVEIIAPHRSRA